MKKIITICIGLLTLNAHSQEVYTIGKARNVMMGIDLNSTVQIDTLQQKANLFALGPVDNLQGEITVLNSKVHTSKIVNGKIVTMVNAQVKAPFLVYSYVSDWVSYKVNVDFENLKSIETVIDSLGQKHGYSPDEAFPFMLKASWDQLDFHIIMRDTAQYEHSHELHDKAKIKLERIEIPATLLGFFSRHHEGVFTHRGQYIHVHYLKDDETETGHLDGIKHNGWVQILLPTY